MRRKVIGIGVAVVLALVGTVLLTSYVQNAREEAISGEELVEVYVVQDRISAGTAGDAVAGNVAVEEIPRKVRVDDAVVDLDDLDGRFASTDLVPGEQLLASRFIAQAELDRDRDIPVVVPDTLHEISFSLEPERVVGGELRPGDTVSFIASFEPFDTLGERAEGEPQEFVGGLVIEDRSPSVTSMLLHDILVTNVQVEQQVDDSDDDEPAFAPSGNIIVTLAVDAHQAERMVFAKEFGRVWLTFEPEGAVQNDEFTTFPMELFERAENFVSGADPETASPPAGTQSSGTEDVLTAEENR